MHRKLTLGLSVDSDFLLSNIIDIHYHRKSGTESGMKAIVLVLLVGLAASAHAQSCGKTSPLPVRCRIYPLPAVAPAQWEGNIFELIGTSEAEITQYRIGKESYDATNLRRRYIEEQMESRERDYYDYLFLHKEVQCVTRLLYA